MKACPTPMCSQTVPEEFLPDMQCFLCLRFGPPAVRNGPVVKIERRKRERL
jgi:hypothetical protein